MPLPPTPFIPDGIFFTLGIYTQQTALDSDPGDTAVHLDPCRAAGWRMRAGSSTAGTA
mgnify:CR=1 FL=1